MKLFDELRLVGGEMHFNRVQERYWPAILDAMQQLGTEVLATYMMWPLMELREGEYDFAQLHRFLAEVERRGMKVLARPGPYYYSEFRNLGIPDHAAPYHKFHPEFRRKASAWIAAILRELKPYFGRLIVLVQADNEIDPMPHFYGEDLGFGDWLRRRYDTIDRLNAAWGSDYRDFAEPFPSLAPLLPDARTRDSCQYRYDLATDYARWVVGEYRAHGCDVPILLNTWPGVDAQHWRDLADLADVYGIDPYPSNECRDDFRYFRERLRLLRAVTETPYIPEFGAGIWHGMPNREYTADHYRLTALTALASGVRGWSWYMLVDRDNWYRAPINERGVIRPELAAGFLDAVAWLKQLEHAPPPETSCALTWSWHYNQLAQINKRDVDDPLPAVLHEMGLEYDWIDVDRDFAPPRLLLLCGDVEQPERLWRYVEEGGTLVLFQRLLPGLPRPDGTSHPGASHLEVSFGDGPAFVTHRPVFHYRRPPGAPITATQLPVPTDDDQRLMWANAIGRTYTTGYVEPRGRGTLLVLGCTPSREAILAIHRRLGVPIPALSHTPGVHVTKRGASLVVLNPGEARAAKIEAGGALRYVDLPRCSGAIVPA